MLDSELQSRLDRCTNQLTPRSIYPQISLGTTTCPACNHREATAYPGGIKCWRPSCSFNTYHSLIDLVKYKENIHGKGSFFKALEILESLAGINFSKSLDATEQRSKALNEASTLYQYYLHQPVGTKALSYLYQRGFTKESILMSEIGYAPTGGLNCLKDKKALRKEGLIGMDGTEYFSNRLTFPIKDRAGNLVHFTGRYLGKPPQSTSGDITPRYKDTKQSEGVFNVKRYLVFEDRLNSYSKDQLVIAEGFPDSLMLLQEGFQVCGLLGLEQLTSHASKLRDFKEITFVFDNDRFPLDHPQYPNQYKSWLRIIPQLIELQIQLSEVRFMVWVVPEESDCKDVNEWKLKGGAFLEDRVELTEYLVQSWGSQRSKHLDLIKLMSITGRGSVQLSKFISSDCSPLDYCLSLFK